MHLSARTQPWPSLVLAVLLTLAGCFGGSDSDDAVTVTPPSAGGTNPPPSGDTAVKNHVTGSVGDGSIVGARIRVFANNGALIQETKSGITADYQLTVDTQGANYVLNIEADQGTDLMTGRTPDFTLRYAIYRHTNYSTINLNPFSTLIFQVAQTNGGINDSTVSAARHAVVTRYGFGLDSAVLPDPIETPIDDANIPYIVKASETLGEMIRRTRDTMVATGLNVDGDYIVSALAADLADGWIDGNGADQSSSRLAAVANVASAAVLIEAMSNQLMVDGVDATAAMDQSIRQARPDAPQSAATANVPIAAEALEQVIRVLRAAQLVNPDTRIATTIEVMEAAKPDVLPAEITTLLPAGIHGALRKATTDTAYAPEAVINAVNLKASTSSSIKLPPKPEPDPEATPPAPDPEPTPPEPDPEPEPQPTPPTSANTPPGISGAPNTALVVGTAWSFTPNASDRDGDPLTFSVTGRPSWMSFNSSTGRLSGTPGSSSVGTYSNIRISVTDGTATTQLPAFSLTVTAPQLSTGSATLSWTPPTERTDGSPLNSLSGFKIYYSRDRSNLNEVVSIGSGITTYYLEGLEPGTWFFGVSAVDRNGIESALSTVVSKTIP